MKQTTLKFLRFHCLDRHHCAVQYHQLIDGIITRFEQSHPNIRFDSTVMRNWYQLMYTLNKKLDTEDGPDIFHTNGGGELEDLVKRGLVYDLTPELDIGWRESFFQASFYPLTFNRREYAIPLEQGFIFIWYNKKIFKEFGFSIPRTFDDLLIICKELSRSGIIPFTVGNKERWPGAFFFSHLFQRIGGEEVFVPDFTTAPNYDDIRESFIAAAEKVIELAAAGAFHRDCNFTDYQQKRQLFIQRKAAMQLNGNRLLDYLKLEGPEILDDLDIFFFPLVNGGKGKASTIFGGSLATYAISANSRHKREATAFLKSLSDKYAARDVICNMGDIPAVKHVPYEDYPSPIHGRIAQKLEGAQKILVHYFKSLPPKPAGVYLNVVSKLLTRDISPSDAFKTVEEALSYEKSNSLTL